MCSIMTISSDVPSVGTISLYHPQLVRKIGNIPRNEHKRTYPYNYYERYEAGTCPPAGSGPVIMWDGDTVPVDAGFASTAAQQLLQVCKDYGAYGKLTIYYCYTRRHYEYPGRQQTITEIRRKIPRDEAYVRARSTEWSRDELRSTMKYKIRELQNLGKPGPLMIILSGDPEIVRWSRTITPVAPWPILHIIPAELLEGVFKVIKAPLWSMGWNFTTGICDYTCQGIFVKQNPRWIAPNVYSPYFNCWTLQPHEYLYPYGLSEKALKSGQYSGPWPMTDYYGACFWLFVINT